MANIELIISAIDEYLEKNHLESCTPVEANAMLEQKGLLRDREPHPGLPLRNLLRDGKIPHAKQPDGRHWIIPHS